MKPRPGQKKRHISWNEYWVWVRILARKLPAHHVLYGIPRGGQLLAHLLTYHHFRAILKIDPRFKILVIDDICDTGRTMRPYANVRSFPTACLVWRSTAIIMPTYYAHREDSQDWIVFPYEEFPNV